MTNRDLESVRSSLAALVGQRGGEVEGRVTARDIARFNLAAGETAVGQVAHPLMLSSTREWGTGAPADELRSDGTGSASESWLPLDGLRVMGGGQDLTFHASVLPGAVFSAISQLESVELKRGGSGELLLLTIATEYRDAASREPLLTCRETLIAR